MRQLIFLMGIWLFLLACQPGYKPHRVTLQEDLIEVHFGRNMSRSLLDSIQMELAKKGVSLTYPEIEYDGALLSKLSFVLNYKGQQGAASTNFVYRGYPFGFKIKQPQIDSFHLDVGELSKRD